MVTDWFQLNNTIADLIESKLQRRLESNVWNRNAMLLGILVLLGLASYLLAGFYLAFSGELRNLSQAVMRVSEGDLSTTISSSADDEIAQLLKEFDAMRQVLARLVANIRESSDNIGSASRDIANGNADLSQRTGTPPDPWTTTLPDGSRHALPPRSSNSAHCTAPGPLRPER